MANVSIPEGSDYRGIAIPDPRWKSSAFVRADSTITEANPRPGVVAATRQTGMVLESSGSMPASAGLIPSLTITTNRGGMPGIDESRFTFTPNYSIPAAHQTVVGWDAPTAISRHERLPATVYTAADTTYIGGCTRLSDNTIALSVTSQTAGGTTTAGLIFKRFDSSGYAASAGVSWAWDLSTSGTALAPGITSAVVMGTACVLQLPEGRVQLYWVERLTALAADAYYQVRMAYLDSVGDSLTLSGKPCLVQVIDAGGTSGAGASGFEITRMRVAYNGGQVLMLVQGTAHNTTLTYIDTLWQYASSDLGNTFTRIALDTTPKGGASNEGGLVAGAGSTSAAAFADVAALREGGFVVSYVAVAAAAFNLTTKVLGSAYDDWLAQTANTVLVDTIGSVASGVVGGSNTAIAVDETGQVAVLFQKDSTQSSGVFLSNDSGESWLTCNATLSARNWNQTAATWVPWWENGDPSFYPTGYSCLYQCGRIVVLTSFQVGTAQAPSTDRTKLYEIDLGGYTTACRSFKRAEQGDPDQVVWDKVWIPVERLSDTTGWALTGTGTEVLTTGDYSTMTTAGGQTLQVSTANVNAVTSGNQRTEGVFECKVTAGNSRLEVIVGDGATVYWFWLEFSTTNLLVKDINAATTLYNAAAPSAAGWNQVLWSFDWSTAKVSVYVRASASDVEIRPWKLALVGQAVTSAAAATASRLRVDQPASSASQWRGMHFGSGAYGFPITAESSAGDPTFGRVFSPYPVHVYSGDGVKVRAVDGPTWDGDSWTITQRHEYGVENIFADVAPSPRKTWRSVGTAQQEIVAQLDYSADPTPLLGRVLVVGAFGCNFDSLTIQYRTTAGAGAWNALGVLSLNQSQTSLKWIRDGKVVRPDTAAGAHHSADYYTYNILEGSHLLISDGANPATRKIKTNSEGVWTDTAATVRARVYCEDILTTDAASGTAGEIWSKDGIIMIRDCPDICEIKFLISPSAAGRIVEGYYEIGSLFVGHLAYFGKQYARGRALAMTTNTAMTTGRAGARRARALGPARRSVEFGWAAENEADASRLVGLTGGAVPTPDYILPATNSTEPVATPADTPYKMSGLVEAMRGAATPCIYLARAPMVATEATDTVLVNRNLFMLGRLVSDPRIETVLGSEWATAGEVMRLATVTFEEEV